MANTTIATVGDSDFQEKVHNAELPVLVMFTATWSAPDRGVENSLTELASDYENKVFIYRCDIDASPNAASQYDIRNFPTLSIFKGRYTPTATRIGVLPTAQLKSWIDANV
jgi:thioredoxin 1